MFGGGKLKAENKELLERLSAITTEYAHTSSRLKEVEEELARSGDAAALAGLRAQLQASEETKSRLERELASQRLASSRLRDELEELRAKYEPESGHAGAVQEEAPPPGAAAPPLVESKAQAAVLLQRCTALPYGVDSPSAVLQENYADARLRDLSDYCGEMSKLLAAFTEAGKSFATAGTALAAALDKAKYQRWASGITPLCEALTLFGRIVSEQATYLEVFMLSVDSGLAAGLAQLQRGELAPVRALKAKVASARAEADTALARVLGVKRTSEEVAAHNATLAGKAAPGSAAAAPGAANLTARVNAAVTAVKRFESTRFEFARRVNEVEVSKRVLIMQNVCSCLYASRAYFSHCADIVAGSEATMRDLQGIAADGAVRARQREEDWRRIHSVLSSAIARARAGMPGGELGMGVVRPAGSAGPGAEDGDPHHPLDVVAAAVQEAIASVGQVEAGVAAELSAVRESAGSGGDAEHHPVIAAALAAESPHAAFAGAGASASTSVDEGSPGALGKAGGELHAGYLWKKSTNLRREWQKRWFSIRAGKLFYVRGPEDMSPQLVTPLVVASTKQITACAARAGGELNGLGVSASTAGASASTGPLAGIAPAAPARAVSEEGDASVRAYVFEVRSPQQRPYELQAATLAQQDAWIAALRGAGEDELVMHRRRKSTVGMLPQPATLGGSGGSGGDSAACIGSMAHDPIMRQLQQAAELDNTACVDCAAPTPDWCSINTGALLCVRCAGVHRALGVHVSKVRSVTLDRWTAVNVAMVACLGNAVVNKLWCSAGDAGTKPCLDSDRAAREQYIRRKWAERDFALQPQLLPSFMPCASSLSLHLPADAEPQAVSTAWLFTASAAGDVQGVLAALAAGGSTSATWGDPGLPDSVPTKHGTSTSPALEGLWQWRPAEADAVLMPTAFLPGRTPLHLAAWCGCPVVIELLLQNGAALRAADGNGMTALDVAASRLAESGEEPAISPTQTPLPAADSLQELVQQYSALGLFSACIEVFAQRGLALPTPPGVQPGPPEESAGEGSSVGETGSVSSQQAADEA